MTRRAPLLLLLAGAAALAACGDEPKRPPPRPAAPRPAAGAPGSPASPAGATAAATGTPDGGAPEEPKPAVEPPYSSVGKRDPFHSFLADLKSAGTGLATRCATPLGRFELEQLHLVAVVTGIADPVAMVEAPNGVGYDVRRGSCIGKNGGTVTSIRKDPTDNRGEIVVNEFITRADGTREKNTTTLKLPAEESATPEEQ